MKPLQKCRDWFLGVPDSQDWHIVAILYFFCGIIYLIVTPPFEVPDEPNHFYRAYQIAQGQWVSQKNGDACGGAIPASLVRTTEFVMDDIAFNPHIKQDPKTIIQAFQIHLEPQNMVFGHFPNTSLISPIPYLPQVIGILLGKAFGGPPILLLYLGRLFNLLVSMSVLLIAFRTIPFLKNGLVLLIFMPMSIYLAASMSPDALTTALSYVLISFIFKAAFGPQETVSGREYATIWVLAILLSLCKSAYCILPLAWLIVPPRKFKHFYQYVGSSALIISASFLSSMLWAVKVSKIYTPSLPGHNLFPTMNDASAYILDHPIAFLEVMFNSLIHYYPFVASSFVGVFGWLDTPLSLPFVLVYLVLLCAVAISDTGSVKIGAIERGWIICTVMLGFLLVFTSQFMIWTAQGSRIVGGLQGRYFIPFALLMLATLGMNKGNLKERLMPVQKYCKFIVLISSFYSYFVLLQRFYLG